MDQSHYPFVGLDLKVEQSLIWTCSKKLTQKEIESLWDEYTVKLQSKYLFFFCGGRNLNVKSYIFYALSLAAELSLQDFR